MKFFLPIFISFIISLNLTAQDFGWAIKQSGNDSEGVYDIAEDGFGNIYEIGNFWGTVDFDPSATTYNLTSAGLTDNFICKLDASGNFIWAKRFGGTAFEQGTDIALDANDNIYAGGSFQSTVDFDPSASTYNLTSSGGEEAYIASYDNNGDFKWAAKFGSTGADYIQGMVELDGYLYATGYFQGTVDFDPGANVFNLTASGADATFILKMDIEGNFVWAKSISGTSSTLSFDIDADEEGNVYTGGEFWGTCDFDPGTGTQSITALGFTSDAFLLKLDESGNFAWVDIFKGNSDDWVRAVDVHGNSEVSVCGAFQSTADFDPGPGTFNLTSNGNYDMFTAKLSASDGVLQWAVATGGTLNDQVLDLFVSDAGDYYLTGSYSGTVDFDPGTGSYLLTAVGAGDIFYHQLTAAGEFGNAYGFSSLFTSSSGNTIIADNAGRITFAGSFANTVDFDPGPDVFNLTSNLTTYDCFVVQFNSCIPFQTTTATTICAGDSVFAGGNFQTTSGEYIDYLSAANGCDSIVTLDLTVLPPINTFIEGTICEGDHYFFNGNNISTAGTYTAILNAANGCDSIVTLTLLVHPVVETSMDATICEGGSYFFNGTEIFSEGIYTAILLTTTGCDSIVTLHLDVAPVFNSEISETICEGESVLFDGNEIDSAGDYSATYTSVNGCDSAVTLHLDVITINASLTQINDTLIASGIGMVQWILCESGLPVTSATDFVFIPDIPGVYAAVITNGDCSDTTECSIVYTSVNVTKDDFEVFVSPNPATERVTLQVSNVSIPVTAELRSAFGELVERKESASSLLTFSVAQFPAGVYFVYVFSRKKLVVNKLVIE